MTQVQRGVNFPAAPWRTQSWWLFLSPCCGGSCFLSSQQPHSVPQAWVEQRRGCVQEWVRFLPMGFATFAFSSNTGWDLPPAPEITFSICQAANIGKKGPLAGEQHVTISQTLATKTHDQVCSWLIHQAEDQSGFIYMKHFRGRLTLSHPANKKSRQGICSQKVHKNVFFLQNLSDKIIWLYRIRTVTGTMSRADSLPASALHYSVFHIEDATFGSWL